MAVKKAKTGVTPAPVDDKAAIDELLRKLAHPFDAEIQATRKAILACDPAVHEELKWNSPSFRAADSFATIHLRHKDGVAVILHKGAKKRAAKAPPLSLTDPTGIVKWLGVDRCLVELRGGDEFAVRVQSLAAIVRQWLAQE